ncbi:MAG: glycerol-3-phosphate 1-O-acyltransferase PlsY [Oscillospiraceae bacterium]
MTIAITAGIALLSYLIGSISFAIIVSRLYAGDDVRRHGSGNAGMTNMLRTYGKGPAALTFLGDFFKAAVAIALSRWILAWAGVTLPLDVGYIAGLSALLGHLFPVYFHFKGGKGVASSLGIIVCINPLVFLIIAVVFVPLVFITRIVSLASVLGALFYPFITWLVLSRQGADPWCDTLGAAVIGALVLVMHRDNIKRLLTGTERRFGTKK